MADRVIANLVKLARHSKASCTARFVAVTEAQVHAMFALVVGGFK